MENPYELMYMARCKDTYAENQLVTMYYPMIWSTIRTYAQYDQILNEYREDLILEADVAVLQAVDAYRYDQNAGINTFVKLVVERKLINEIRFHQRNRRNMNLVATSFDTCLRDNICLYDVEAQRSRMNEPEYYLWYQEGLDALRKEINAMSVGELEILCKVEERNVSYQSAAESLGISIKAYDGRRQRVKEKLKKCLNKGY